MKRAMSDVAILKKKKKKKKKDNSNNNSNRQAAAQSAHGYARNVRTEKPFDQRTKAPQVRSVCRSVHVFGHNLVVPAPYFVAKTVLGVQNAEKIAVVERPTLSHAET
nr:hypothetical protein BaRGS_023067 [Batillaria attramentaria]